MKFDYMMKNKHYLGIFLISLATLMLEVGLVKLFSIIQFYYFAFLIVSVAMFGTAAAGTFLYIKKLKKPLLASAILFSITTLIGFLFLNNYAFSPIEASVSYVHCTGLILYYILLGLPFFFSGIIITHILMEHKEESGKIYFCNLSGAAFGSLGVLPIISLLGEKIIFLVFITGLLASALFAEKTRKALIMVLASSLILLAPIQLNLSPYKELERALDYPESNHLSTEWNSYSRVDVVNSSFARYAPGLSSEYRTRLPNQVGVFVDGSNMNPITEYKDLGFIDYLPTSIGYNLIEKPRTLIINAGAGLDVLIALEKNANVTAVESNPLVIDLLKEEYKDYSGNIYNKAGIHVEEGRGFIKGRGEYDIIILSLAGSVLGSGFYGLSENYLLTVEAFREYYDHLSDEGILIITRWLYYPPKESLRLFSLALEVNESAKNIGLFRTWTTVTLLLGRKEFSENRIKKIMDFVEKNKFDIIYLPAEFEPNKHGEFEEPYYYESVNNLLEDREGFYNNYLFDVSPVYDDKPFYFNFFKLNKAGALYEIIGESWQPFMDQGFLLLFLLAQAALLSSAFILLPLKFLKNTKIKKKPLVFFFCIGLAYMFVEIVFIQKFILLFGMVIYSVSTVIFSTLLSSSIGSLYSRKLKVKDTSKIIIIISTLIILYYFLTPVIINSIISFSMAAKMIIVFLIIALPAFFMGMLFPIAIKSINKNLVPWAFAVNGSASVLSSVLAILLALSYGYSIVLVLAAISYLFSSLFLKRNA